MENVKVKFEMGLSGCQKHKLIQLTWTILLSMVMTKFHFIFCLHIFFKKNSWLIGGEKKKNKQTFQICWSFKLFAGYVALWKTFVFFACSFCKDFFPKYEKIKFIFFYITLGSTESVNQLKNVWRKWNMLRY